MKARDASNGGLERRDFLRLVAGLPLVLGLPRLARAQDGARPGAAGQGGVGGAEGANPGDGGDEGCTPPPPGSAEDLVAAIGRARILGRPVLLVVVPTAQDPGPGATDGCPIETRRQRIAHRLHALLVDREERARLLLANVVIVVGPRRDLAGAVPALAASDGRPRGVWLLDPTRRADADALDVVLDRDKVADGPKGDPVQAALQRALVSRVLPADETPETVDALLGPRAAREREALAGERAKVERDLADLGSERFDTREAAGRRLAELADRIAATLTSLALRSPDAETRARAHALVLESTRDLVPVGATWASFTPGCGANDPYDENLGMVDCGMARGGPARPWLRFLTQD